MTECGSACGKENRYDDDLLLFGPFQCDPCGLRIIERPLYRFWVLPFLVFRGEMMAEVLHCSRKRRERKSLSLWRLWQHEYKICMKSFMRSNTHSSCLLWCTALPYLTDNGGCNCDFASWIARFLEPLLHREHVRLPPKLLIKGFCSHLPRSDG